MLPHLPPPLPLPLPVAATAAVFADASGQRDRLGNFIYTRRDNVLMMACFFAYKVCKRKEAENIYEIAAELASECRKKLEN